MLTWSLAIPLDPASSTSLFLQIAHGITAAVNSGRLAPGDPLPSLRLLAQELGVNRNTVLAAYQELAAEGLLESRPGGASHVADPLPGRSLDPGPRNQTTAPGDGPLGFSLPPQARPPSQPALPKAVLDCFTGHADPRLLPRAALARAYSRALKEPAHLTGESPQGLFRLRTALAAKLCPTKGLPASEATLLVTGGISGSLGLVARGLLGPGDRVAVEDPGNPLHAEIFRRAGAEVVPVPVDAQGLNLETLQAVIAQGRLKLLLVTPQCQYPTTVTLSGPRRLELMALARAHRFALLEFDQDADFHYQGAPILPLASQDPYAQVIYLGAFSKVLFPNLPMAFLHGPEPLIQHLSHWRKAGEPGNDPMLERALAELVEDGEILRLLNRLRKTCHARRDRFQALLAQALPEQLRVHPPRCGMSFWVETAPGLDLEAWAARAAQQGVAFRTGRQFTFDHRPLPALRFGFGALEELELQEAVRRLSRACPGN